VPSSPFAAETDGTFWSQLHANFNGSPHESSALAGFDRGVALATKLVCRWRLHGMLPACAHGSPHCPSATVAAGLHNPARLLTASSKHLTSDHLCTGADKTPRTASPSAGSSSAKIINLHSGECAACMALLQADARAGAANMLNCKGCHFAPVWLTFLLRHSAGSVNSLGTAHTDLTFPDMPWTDWHIDARDLEVAQLDGGGMWKLGAGAFGEVIPPPVESGFRSSQGLCCTFSCTNTVVLTSWFLGAPGAAARK
jgi:hypothetical protein